MTTRICACCEMEISKERLTAVPSATLCAICLVVQGDVPKVRGCMTWEHKTAPTIVIGPDAEKILPYQRRGVHAQLPFNAKENPRLRAYTGNLDISIAIREKLPEEDTDYVLVSFIPARCHPDRPKLNVAGDCLECALEKQKLRVKRN